MTAIKPQPDANSGSKLVRSGPSAAPRHFLDLTDRTAAEINGILDLSRSLRAERHGCFPGDGPLAGKVLAMVFERPSTRTRVSFDVGMRELGGQTIMLTGAEMQLGRGETIADTARVLSRYVDAIMIRILDHDALTELAEYATVPVINGLTKLSHPCQIMADLLTYEDHRGSIVGRTVSWVGDDNNVLASWVHAAGKLDFKLKIATPPELKPADELMALGNGRVSWSSDPFEAVEGTDCIITDTWVSMGDKERERRHNLLAPYQVNDRLMAAADKDAIFMHCLPAHREEEVTASVIDGPQSVVFDEAENRLHAHKGVLAWAFGYGS